MVNADESQGTGPGEKTWLLSEPRVQEISTARRASQDAQQLRHQVRVNARLRPRDTGSL